MLEVLCVQAAGTSTATDACPDFSPLEHRSAALTKGSVGRTAFVQLVSLLDSPYPELLPKYELVHLLVEPHVHLLPHRDLFKNQPIAPALHEPGARKRGGLYS